MDDELGRGGTDSTGERKPFLVEDDRERPAGAKRPFAFGADATRRRNFAADAFVDFAGGGRAVVPLRWGTRGGETLKDCCDGCAVCGVSGEVGIIGTRDFRPKKLRVFSRGVLGDCV